jgi:hypothetical protein
MKDLITELAVYENQALGGPKRRKAQSHNKEIEQPNWQERAGSGQDTGYF